MACGYYTLEQVAARFGVGPTTITRWRRAGTFPAPVRVGRRLIKWRESDLQAYEASLVQEAPDGVPAFMRENPEFARRLGRPRKSAT